MKEIVLSQGKVALIDDEDFDQVNQYKWHATKGAQTFYAIRHIYLNEKRTTQKLHRFIMKVFKGIEIDHWDGNGLNNQKDNLRIATSRQNNCNSRKQLKSASSKYKGVYYHKQHQKWAAVININEKRKHIGYFNDEIEAALVYDTAAKIHYGEFAKLNFGV